jgi:hypothetical protein
MATIWQGNIGSNVSSVESKTYAVTNGTFMSLFGEGLTNASNLTLPLKEEVLTHLTYTWTSFISIQFKD